MSNPEFLREGHAVSDFLNPERVVVGADDEEVAFRVAALHLRLSAPLLVTDPASAELIKYASNAFLALKLSYVNAIAAVAEAVDADIDARGQGPRARQPGRRTVPAAGPGLGRQLPAQGHQRADPHRRGRRLRLHACSRTSCR